MNGPTVFDLSSVFSTVAGAVPDQEMLVWRERRLTYSEVDRRIDAFAAYLRIAGLGCHTERKYLARHESGQDHLGIYLRNGTEYLEAMIAGYRARVAPFNVSYRYVEDELTFLLADANARPDLSRRVRATHRCHPRALASSAGAHPGGRRLGSRLAARGRRLRIHHRCNTTHSRIGRALRR
jgi:acyl-CoA synthetase (AMP-forming)/AMP-acid ligase II